MNVVIYSKNNCVYCDMAIKLTQDNKFNLVIKKLDVDFNREELLELFPEAKSFPQIIINDVHLGGYTEFKKFLQHSW